MSFANTIFNWLGYARYNTVKPSATNGAAVELQATQHGELKVAVNYADTLWSYPAGVDSERIEKVTNGKIHRIWGENQSGSLKYFFIFNTNARPSNGATGQLHVLTVPAGSSFQIDFSPRPRTCSVGIYWGISTTQATFTYDASADFSVAVEYE